MLGKTFRIKAPSIAQENEIFKITEVHTQANLGGAITCTVVCIRGPRSGEAFKNANIGYAGELAAAYIWVSVIKNQPKEIL